MKHVMLVIDDEPQIQELIKSYLFGVDVEIHSAYTGEEGVEMYRELMEKRERPPDLVVMDLNLSGSRKTDDMLKQFSKKGEMDGLRTTQEIKRIDPHATIVGFTAFAHVRWGEMLKKMGAEAVFGRDIGFDGFAEEVRQVFA